MVIKEGGGSYVGPIHEPREEKLAEMVVIGRKDLPILWVEKTVIVKLLVLIPHPKVKISGIQASSPFPVW